MGMVAAIFGGSGFIGSHLYKKISKDNDYEKIIIFDITPPSYRLSETDSYIFCDVRQEIDIPDIPDFFDHIYNLAAVHRTPGHEPYEYYLTNVCGAVNICKFSEKKDGKFIFFTSSISVYGPTENLVDETTPLSPKTDYGYSKMLAEKIHVHWSEGEPGRRLVIARPGVVFGKGEKGNFSRLSKMLKRKLFVYPGRRDTLKSCGYVKDLIETIEHTKSQHDNVIIYNYCFRDIPTISKICNEFSEYPGMQKTVFVVPFFLLHLIGAFFEVMNFIGVKNGINVARIKKLSFSTNVYPRYLSENYKGSYDLKSSISDWYNDSGEFE
jgi:nucleoside-diphosphate-sugar epimerase